MENYKTFGTLMDTKHNPAWKKIRQISDEACKEMENSSKVYHGKKNFAMNQTVLFCGLIRLRIFLKSAD